MCVGIADAEDPPSNFEALPCEPQETYPAGGVMSMHIDIAANHGGVWEVSVCDRKDISQACFDQNKLKTCAFVHSVCPLCEEPHDAACWCRAGSRINRPGPIVNDESDLTLTPNNLRIVLYTTLRE